MNSMVLMIPMVEGVVFALGTRITMADGSMKKIEDINVGDYVKSAQIPNVPLDFDQKTLGKLGLVYLMKPPNNVWNVFYDIQELNRFHLFGGSVFDIYYDFYDSYFLVNDKIKSLGNIPFSY